MNIVLLGREDAKELSELENSCFSSGWTSDQFYQILSERKVFDFSLLYPRPKESLEGNIDAAYDVCQHFSRKEMPVLGVFSEQNELIGYISIRLVDVEAEVYNIAIKKEVRGKNIATLLMGTALTLIKLSGIKIVFLEVRESNTPARALYKKMGFLPIGIRKSYYPDGESALLMSCALDKLPK